jgi:hypothetical protein
MVATIEELDSTANPVPGTVAATGTRWNFSPLQAIPRNAEALWNLIDSVYFAAVPIGHELFEGLSPLVGDPMRLLESSQKILSGASCLKMNYTFDGPSGKSEQSVPGVIQFAVKDGNPSILFSDTLLPPLDPPTRRLFDKNKSKGQIQSSAEQSTASTPDEEPKWKLSDSLLDTPMLDDTFGDEAEIQLELAFLESELGTLQAQRCAVVKRILDNMENDQRPSRKAWFDAEQNLLNLYEKRPPSAFMPTAATLASNGRCTTGVDPIPLNFLGKVDSALPDSFKDAELCCCVCGEGDTTDDNDILICDGCSFAAHQDCYFVKSIPDGQWFCQLCESFNHKSSKSSKASRRVGGEGLEEFLASISCSLCLQSATFEGGGLMKPTSNSGQWAHVKCAVWVPEAAFPPDGLSITVISNAERESLRCSICKQKGGCPLQCAFGKCVSAFHVSCAARVGLLPEEKSLKNLYCTRHMRIQLKTSPCTSRLLSVRKQDIYLRVMGDKLFAPKIGGSLLTPNYDPLCDAEQSYTLQIAGVHPAVVKELGLSPDGLSGFIGANDLMEETIPLIKEVWDVVPIGEQGKDTFIELNSCCECMRVISDDDLYVKCESCNLLAHALCYERPGVPVPNVDDLNDPLIKRVIKWDGGLSKFGTAKAGCINLTCTRCQMLLSVPTPTAPVLKMVNTHCLLCMQMGGILLPIQPEQDDDDEVQSASSSPSNFLTPFAHPRCIWWLLASSMLSLGQSPLMQIRSIPSNYHFHPCHVCGSRNGCTVRCCRVGCDKRFHISCGFHAGAYFTVRSNNMVVAGARDYEEIDDVAESISGPVSQQGGIRKIITCWNHEPKGARRNIPQLGRNRPSKVELVRWVPEGIRSELVTVVNQVLMGGEVAGVGIASEAKPKERRPPRQPKKREDKEDSDWSETEGGRRNKKKRGRPTKASESPLISQGGRAQTVRYVDGQEVTCEEEDWEGSCAICRKAWTDSTGQVLDSICCDKCDQWFHFSCVGIERAPMGEFICPLCLI